VFAKLRFKVIKRFIRQLFSWIPHIAYAAFARWYDEPYDGSTRCGFEHLHRVQNHHHRVDFELLGQFSQCLLILDGLQGYFSLESGTKLSAGLLLHT